MHLIHASVLFENDMRTSECKYENKVCESIEAIFLEVVGEVRDCPS